MNKHNIITLVLYIFLNSLVAALWRLVLFADIIAASTSFAREEPIFPLGLAAMVIHGTPLISIYPKFHIPASWIRSGLLFGASAGLFLAVGGIWVDVAIFGFSEPFTYLAVESIYEVLSYTILGMLLAYRYCSVAGSAA